jgi:hypothetical protein
MEGGTGIGVGLVAFDYAQNAREVFSRTLNVGKGQIVYNGELQGITQAVRGQAEDSRKARVNHDEFDEELSEQEGRLAL